MKTIVFILGVHRSGTSALSGLMRFCGYDHGCQLLDPAPDNPAGFWEPRPVVDTNQRILKAMGGGWDRVPAWLHWPEQTPIDLGPWLKETFTEVAVAAWDQAFGEGAFAAQRIDNGQHPLVCKDPRLCLTLPLWLHVASQKGYASRVLCTHRPPRAIMRSLTRRNDMGFAQAADLVTDYWAHAISHFPEGAGVVRYDALLQSPDQVLNGQGLHFTDEQAHKNALDFLSDGRNVPPEPEPKVASPLPRPLASLDKALLALADGAELQSIREGLKSIKDQRADHKRYQGNTYCLGTPYKAAPSRPGKDRVAVLHCHIFKNAGSSVDVLLREHFGARFLETEFETRAADSNADLMRSFIQCRTDGDAFSTHTGDWWLDYHDEDLKVLPIVFLRHPLLRIQSAYRFERTQTAETYGARKAKMLSFADYVEDRLARAHDFAFRNFQARRIAAFHARQVTDLPSIARAAFDRLPYLGIVEDFEASARRLEAYLQPHFPAFTARPVAANRTDDGTMALADRLSAIRTDLGDNLYRDLQDANAVDFHLYDAARARDALAA